MRKIIICLMLGLTLVSGKGMAASLTVNGADLDGSANRVYGQTTYVPLRTVTQALLPDAEIGWEGNRAAAYDAGMTLTARPGAQYIEMNGRVLYVPGGVRLENGVTLVPVRVLAKALGASVHWDAATGAITVTGDAGALKSGEDYYDAEALYWLARIISAESRGESFRGQLAVGGVVLNRVASSEFPGTVYDVVFDSRWGGQFEPVRNGTVYNEPAAESVAAAKICLEGVDISDGSLYFLAPALTDNHWIMRNCTYVMRIGCHWFYR